MYKALVSCELLLYKTFPSHLGFTYILLVNALDNRKYILLTEVNKALGRTVWLRHICDIIIIVVDLKRHNGLKVGTEKTKPKVKMQ